MNNWLQLPFLDVFQDVTGGNDKVPQNTYQAEGIFPVVDQGKKLISGYSNDSSQLCKSSVPVIVFGDHTRALKYVDFPFCMGADGIKILKPKIDADTKFLYYALRNTSIPNAGYDRHFKYLKRVEIPLPPLAEQKRLAAILDRADELRRVRRESLERLDELAQSLFLELFGDPATNPKGWNVVHLGEVCPRSGKYGANASACEFKPKLPRYIRITDIDENGDLKSAKVGLNSDDWTDYVLEAGDLLFARSGATVGKTYLVKESDGLCVYAGYLIRFQTDKSRLHPVYLSEFTRSENYNRWVRSKQNVVAQPNINAKQYADLERVMDFCKLVVCPARVIPVT